MTLNQTVYENTLMNLWDWMRFEAESIYGSITWKLHLPHSSSANLDKEISDSKSQPINYIWMKRNRVAVNENE